MTDMQDNIIINAQGLTKRYRRVVGGQGFLGLMHRTTQQVDGLIDASFTIRQGEIVGLLGPNGAGKSTTVKLMSGILTPDSGTCTVMELEPWSQRKQNAAHIGAVFGQRRQLWWDVPIMDSFRLLRDIYAIPQDRFDVRLHELCDALELNDLLTVPLRQMSLGQRMRSELCGSLLHEPAILFLDEPTIGLDAVSKLSLRQFLLRENAKRGTTILLTTHDTADMLALCPRVMVLGHGRLLYDGGLDTLLKRYDTHHTLKCAFDGEPVWSALPPTIAPQRDGNEWTITFAPGDCPTSHVLNAVLAAGPVRELTLQEQAVDELIARMYRDMGLA